MSDLLAVTEATWDSEVLGSDRPVLVDFWAEWCGPCKALAPTIDALSQEFGGRVRFVKLNTDENPAIGPKYAIRGIPTLILFQAGQEVERIVGNWPKRVLKNRIDARVGAAEAAG